MVRSGTRDEDRGWSGSSRVAARLPRLLAELREHPQSLALLAFGRVPALRRLVAHRIARRRPAATSAGAEAISGLQGAVPIGKAVEALRRHGLLTGLRLPREQVMAIRAFADAAICHGGPGNRVRFRAEEQEETARREGVALPVGHLGDIQGRCPAAAAIAEDPWLRATAAAYLGARPILIDLRLWWSFPAPGASRVERSAVAQDAYHFDLGDWRQLKAFVYLTDVGPEDGPHAYVRGSHARRPLRRQLDPFSACSSGRLAAAYGVEAFATLTGPAGTAFVEDPFGFHTGLAVQTGRRLMLEVSFGITATTRRATLFEAGS